MFEYLAAVERIIDGDTLVARLDLGCHVSVVQPLRLLGINTPERKDKVAWAAAGKFLGSLCYGHEKLIVRTVKDSTEKYGRYLAVLFAGDDPVSVNQKMVDAGHAVPYMTIPQRAAPVDAITRL